MKQIIASLITILTIGFSINGQAQCRPHDLPQAYFGDLHVHTGLSNDANGMGVNARPADAYRYAKGESITINDSLTVEPRAKLDFAAVTDHAEQLAAATLCHDSSEPSYNSWSCKLERSRPRLGLILGAISGSLWGQPGGPHCADGSCRKVAESAWQETVSAAEKANVPCAFTSFVAYEWSGNGEGGATIHRNVIFNQNPDIERPFGAQQFKTPEALFSQLREHCVENSTGCDALTIPHNSNLSKGEMFPRWENSTAINASDRHYFDRLAEIIQHKGASECYSGAVDEACQFEALPYSSFIGKFLTFAAKPAENDTSFVREALKEGLRFENANPYQLGLIGSTDTHLGTSGQVEEKTYTEHHNKQRKVEGVTVSRQPELNPGGLAVIYARRNTREALFDAMKRREVYGTSGTRIGLRFFAGDELPEKLCDNPYSLDWSYRRGVPMGANLSAENPHFLAMANSAPGEKSAGLQSLQLIKGWVDESGTTHEKVIALAESERKDPASCQQLTRTRQTLCAQWEDPEYNPEQRAFYYVRVLEQPSCRWNQYQCEYLQDDSARAALNCNDPNRFIQERAWSSPIWTSPKN